MLHVYFEIVTSISELQNSENIIWQESGESTSKRYLLFYSTLVINSSFQHKKGKSEIGDLHETKVFDTLISIYSSKTISVLDKCHIQPERKILFPLKSPLFLSLLH